HDAERVRHTARNRPQHTRATPSHAFQHLAPAKAVSMVEFTHCESPLSRWFPAGTATRLARARFDERRIYSRFGKEFDDGQGRLLGVSLWQDTAIHSDGLIYSLKVSVFGSHQRANVDSLANDGGASFSGASSLRFTSAGLSQTYTGWLIVMSVVGHAATP